MREIELVAIACGLKGFPYVAFPPAIMPLWVEPELVRPVLVAAPEPPAASGQEPTLKSGISRTAPALPDPTKDDVLAAGMSSPSKAMPTPSWIPPAEQVVVSSPMVEPTSSLPQARHFALLTELEAGKRKPVTGAVPCNTRRAPRPAAKVTLAKANRN